MIRDTKMQVSTQFFLQTLTKTFIRRLSDFNFKLYLEAYLNPFANDEFIDIITED